MSDPLSDIIRLLQPQAIITKAISGAGNWGVRYAEFGQRSFAIVLEGSCRLAVDGQPELTLVAGDFVLLPKTPGFTMSGFERTKPKLIDPRVATETTGELRHGNQHGPPSVRIQGGYFRFRSEDSVLLLSLFPDLIHVRGETRLSTLVMLLAEEAAFSRSGRELVLARLVEILLVEALRLRQAPDASVGLMRGLGDVRLAEAIRQMHTDPARRWTTANLAKTVAMSRSAFFDRFSRNVGVPPMAYLLAWRMALAKDLLHRSDTSIAEVAERIGYGSASTFSTAFSRYVGLPPGKYAATLQLKPWMASGYGLR